MEAKKKPVTTLALADLGIDAGEVGFAGASTAVVEASKRPVRSGGTRVTDEGEGGAKLVEYLATEKFV
jgi:electron transfer flavoprotein beta subunit